MQGIGTISCDIVRLEVLARAEETEEAERRRISSQVYSCWVGLTVEVLSVDGKGTVPFRRLG